MDTAEQLFERAKRLNAEELIHLLRLLEGYLSSETILKGPELKEPSANLLTLSGIADSDYTDVSSHKAKHLARAYGPRRGD